MAQEIHHIFPNDHGGWCIRREGEEKPFINTDTKIKAIKIGNEISKKQDTLVVVHDKEHRLYRPGAHPEIPFPFPFQPNSGPHNNESLLSNDQDSPAAPAAQPGFVQNRGAYQ